jgi:hypothetical protein
MFLKFKPDFLKKINLRCFPTLRRHSFEKVVSFLSALEVSVVVFFEMQLNGSLIYINTFGNILP